MPKRDSESLAAMFVRLSHMVDANGSGDDRNGHCPVHHDKNASLSISLREDSILVKCQSGCDQDAVIEALREHGINLPRPGGRGRIRARTAVAQRSGTEKLGKITAVYEYTNEHGETLFTKARYLTEDGGKTFQCGRGLTTAKFQPGPIPEWVNAPLYKLPELIEAIDSGAVVWVVGGEKDVESLQEAGEYATCNHDGEAHWTEDHAIQLTGAAEVRIVKDNDRGGEQFAYDVQTSLEGLVGLVTVWQAAVPQKGADVSDHLAAGYTLDQLERVDTVTDLRFTDDVRREAYRLDVRREATRQSAMSLLSPSAVPVTMDELEELPDPDYLVKVLMPKNSISEVFGASGSYKSFVMLDCALHVATGQNRWHGHRVRQGKVLYVASEGGMGISKRIRAWHTHHGIRPDSKHLMVLPYPFQIVATDALLTRLRDADFEPDWVIFDTRATSTTGMDENSATDMGLVTDSMRRLSVELGGAAVTTVHHTGWSETERARGASSVPAAMDTIWRIKGERNGHKFATIRCTKAKEDEAPPEFKVELKVVSLVETDADGDRITSLAVDKGEILTRDERTEPDANQLSDKAREFVAVLDTAGAPGISFGRRKILAWCAEKGIDTPHNRVIDEAARFRAARLMGK